MAVGFSCKTIGWLWVSVAKPLGGCGFQLQNHWVAMCFSCITLGGCGFQLQNHWVAVGFNCKTIGWLWVSIAKLDGGFVSVAKPLGGYGFQKQNHWAVANHWVAIDITCKIIGQLQNHWVAVWIQNLWASICFRPVTKLLGRCKIIGQLQND